MIKKENFSICSQIPAEFSFHQMHLHSFCNLIAQAEAKSWSLDTNNMKKREKPDLFQD